MVDLQRIRDMRDRIREILGVKIGEPITDEMLSAAVASLSEVWTFRILCSPERHTNLSAIDLMKRVSEEISSLLMKQADEMLPHAKTFSFFHKPEDPKR